MIQDTPVPAPGDPGTPPPEGLPRLLLHTIAAIALFLLSIIALSLLWRGELEALGRLFVARFGVRGMFLGTWLADALSVPVPPQFYLLTAHLGGARPGPALLWVSVASVLAGHSGYHLARRLGAVPLLRGRVALVRERALPLLLRRGTLTIVVASLSPVPFSWLCYAAGLCRLRYGLFTAFTLLRVPRILFYYLLIRLGWG